MKKIVKMYELFNNCPLVRTGKIVVLHKKGGEEFTALQSKQGDYTKPVSKLKTWEQLPPSQKTNYINDLYELSVMNAEFEAAKDTTLIDHKPDWINEARKLREYRLCHLDEEPIT